jgi:putative inorganic carbon (HCO3(-)) transporter
VTERLAFNRSGSGGLRRLRRSAREYLPLFHYRPEPPPAEERGPTAAAPRRSAAETVWDWRGLLGFTAVLFLRPQDQVPALTILHLAEVSAIIGLTALVVGRLGRGLAPAHITLEVLALAAFGGAILFGVPFSIWPGGVVSVFTDIYLKLLVIFALMIAALNRAQRIEQFAFLIVMFSGYLAFRAVFDWMRGINVVGDGRIAGAVGGMFGNSNDLALNMVVFLPFALLFAFKPGPTVRRAGAAAAAFAMVVTVVLTGSRGGAVGLAVMMLVLVVRSVRVRPSIAAGALVATLAAIPLAPQTFWTRVISIFDGSKDQTGSRQARIDLLEEGWRVFVEHPVTGVGAGQFVNYNPPDRREAWHVTHNAFLEVATETGILGLVPFLVFLVSGCLAPGAARRALRVRRRRIRPGEGRTGEDPPPDPERDSLVLMSTALAPSIVGWIVCAQFASVALSWTLYYVLAIAVATREVAFAHAARTASAARTARAAA